MTYQLAGVVRGNTIELVENPGLIEGQRVELSVTPTPADSKINPKTERPWGEGILASAGAFADWPEAEECMNEILRGRKLDRPREIPE